MKGLLGMINVRTGRIFLDSIKLETLLFGFDKVFVVFRGQLSRSLLDSYTVQKVLKVSEELHKLEDTEESSLEDSLKVYDVYSIDYNIITRVELKKNLIPYRIKIKIKTDQTEFEWTVDPLPGETDLYDRCLSVLQSAFPDKFSS